MALSLSVHLGGSGGTVRRTVMSALAAVVALGLAALGAPAAQATIPDYQPPPVAWGPCTNPPLAGKAECGVVTAPLTAAFC